MEILRVEQENGTLHGVIVQFGGQTPLKLANDLEAEGIPILGTSPDAIDLAEDRERFQELIQKLNLKQPHNGIAHNDEEAFVIASDVGGYFVGRTVGGPKLWPIISPKKTWSGIIGGWMLTVIITYIFIIMFKEIEFYLLFFSIFISIFSQFGDLYESFLKRNAGLKDSSNLIPGHGGFLDRFDGMIGAFFAVFIINFININNWIY